MDLRAGKQQPLTVPVSEQQEPLNASEVGSSDVTKLFKIRIRRMRISTSKIRRIRMRMWLDKRLFYYSECNTPVYGN